MSMDEDCCLDAINNGKTTARDLLTDLMPDAARRFTALDRSIVRLLSDVRRHFPDAEFYTASGGFNLMLGRPHSDKMRGQQELIALSGSARIGDGDF